MSQVTYVIRTYGDLVELRLVEEPPLRVIGNTYGIYVYELFLRSPTG